MEKPRLLIVEDEEDLRNIYTIRFQNAGFEVTGLENGLLAIDQIPTIKPHVILLDLNMPEVDGITMLKLIHKNYSDPNLTNIPVIVSSNYTAQQDIDAAMAAGASMYLKKIEYTGEDLVAKVKDFMVQKGILKTA